MNNLKLIVATAAFMLLVVVLYMYSLKSTSGSEGFATAPAPAKAPSQADEVLNAASAYFKSKLSAVCPSEAYYDADGKIHLEPGGQTFSTMTDYTNFMAAFYARNECKPLTEIKTYKGAPTGVLGGGGTGTESADQISTQAADRSIISTALSDILGSEEDSCASKKGNAVIVSQYGGEQTSARTPINKLDDYEYSRVFELENRNRNAALSKEMKNKLTNQYQLDWSALPFNSEDRSQLEEAFVDARMQDVFVEPKSGIFFRNMEGVDVAPPDEDEAKAREDKILSAYQPTDITKHVVDDEYERVAKVVAQQYSTDPDWEPVVEKRGPHQYAVTELRPRRKKDGADIQWEDDAPTTIEGAKDAGLVAGGAMTPQVHVDDQQLRDPAFDKNGVIDYSNNRFWRYQDFNKWTPGLERMFAPTNDTQAWV
jgi:hypothetical protein